MLSKIKAVVQVRMYVQCNQQKNDIYSYQRVDFYFCQVACAYI